MRRSLFERSRTSVVVVGLLVAASIGCSADPLAEKAESVCLRVMEQNPQFAEYAVTVAARSESPFARRLVLDSIGSDRYKTALEAVRGASERPDPEAEPTLREAFNSREGALQLWAACALAKLGDAEAVEWLKEQADKASGPPQMALILVLAEQGGKESIEPVLRGKMESETQDVRDEAYAALGRIRQPWATELLLEGLEREFGQGRRQAIESLGQTGDPAVASKLTRFVNTQGLVFATLEALGSLGNPEAAPALEKMLGRDQPLVRLYAGTALWRLGALEDPQKTLGPLVADENPRTRLDLAEQLAPIEDDLALSMLAALAEDENKDVRVAAVTAVAARPRPGSVGTLLGRVNDPEYAVSTRALEALGRVASADVAAELEPLLENQNPYVAISAATAILEIKARSPADQG